MSALLECRDLTCGYEAKVVLEHVDLTIDAGEVVALLGPNGSGKSTLLKVLSKSLDPLKGEVLVRGQGLRQLSYRDLAREIAFVPQEETAAFPFLVRDVVTLGRLPYSDSFLDSAEDVRIATEAMEMADCLHLESRPITELSGGERQRVLIARALAQASPLLLLDEPTSHLDVAHQLTIANLIGRLAMEGRGLLVAVHDLNLAASMATRGILLTNRRVGMDAPIQEVLQSPMLDEVYEVEFSRIELPDGRLAILPKTYSEPAAQGQQP